MFPFFKKTSPCWFNDKSDICGKLHTEPSKKNNQGHKLERDSLAKPVSRCGPILTPFGRSEQGCAKRKKLSKVDLFSVCLELSEVSQERVLMH